MNVVIVKVAPQTTMNTSEKRINFFAEVASHMKARKIEKSTPPPYYEPKGGRCQREEEERRKKELELAAKHRETIFTGGSENDGFVVADEGALL